MKLLPLSRLSTLPLKVMVLMLSSLPSLPGSSLAGDAVHHLPRPAGREGIEGLRGRGGRQTGLRLHGPRLARWPRIVRVFRHLRVGYRHRRQPRKIGTVKILPTSYGIKPTVRESSLLHAHQALALDDRTQRKQNVRCTCLPTRPRPIRPIRPARM